MHRLFLLSLLVLLELLVVEVCRRQLQLFLRCLDLGLDVLQILQKSWVYCCLMLSAFT